MPQHIIKTGQGSQDWQSQASWLATVLPCRGSREDLLSCVSGLLCRARGQGSEHLQLFVNDDTIHAFLSTKTVGVIDLAQNRTYVILDLGGTKSMGSRYAINKFMKVAHVRRFGYELAPYTVKFAFANSGATTAWCPKAPPMFTVVDIVEQGRVPIFVPCTA